MVEFSEEGGLPEVGIKILALLIAAGKVYFASSIWKK